MPNTYVSSDELRARFCSALSAMYRAEVPLYGDLIELVDDINDETAKSKPEDRLKVERHGAIRLGKPDELAMIARLFGVMGMQPVGYYDLSPSGVPVHATAFRPVTDEALAYNPFRVFTSLLLPDLLPADVRADVEAALAQRDIFPPKVRELVAKAEKQGGLDHADATELVSSALEIFKWHDTALVDRATYDRMHEAHTLVADIAAFRGPHINHLTPRVLDIDAAQEGMSQRGITPKHIIEGPPRRKCEILLRQTSFQALTEPIRFPGDTAAASGSHRARFGEIEQRGCALTRKGHNLYLQLLSTVHESDDNATRQEALRAAFEPFPDDYAEMARAGLAYFDYKVSDAEAAAKVLAGSSGVVSVLDLVAAGAVTPRPITYEDFLPASAAGIFQSNLDEADRGRGRSHSPSGGSRDQFAKILPVPLRETFEFYDAIQQRSLDVLSDKLGRKIVA